MKYSQQDLMQGMELRQKAQQTPSNFGTIDGALDPQSGKRMAGDRMQELMTNPQEAARTQMWNGRFSMSNEGMQFNQAKMMMSGGGQPPQEA